MTSAPDLFGQLQTLADAPMGPKKRREPTPKGHAASSGSGPKGETCAGCAHIVKRMLPSGRGFLKCGLAKGKWTGGRGSDIRARDPACRLWEKRP